MIIDLYNEPPFPWYKRLYFRIISYFRWNCPLTWRIFRWYDRKFGRDWAKFTFPIIKTYCDNHPLSIDLINVQPMNEPSGQIFYLDFIYTKKKWWQFWKNKI